jgi:hypothetical protein
VGEILITKFMVGVFHELVGDLFEDRLKAMFGPSCRSLCSTRSVRFGNLIGRSKEPDVSFMPRSRDVSSDWPSLVVEVGASESLSCLRGDLKYWLRTTNGMTRVAILLHINKVDGMILIERWANVNYGVTIQMAERILLDAQVVYNGPFLSIPADQVFDNVPTNVRPGQFTLTAQDLDYFDNEFWSAVHVAPR